MKILKNNLLLFFSVISFLGFGQTYVYQEEFDSTNGWPTGNNETRELSVYNGRYYFEHKRTTDSWRVTTSDFALSNSDDFEIQTSIQKISGVQDYGISFLYDFDHFFETDAPAKCITTETFSNAARSISPLPGFQ